MEFCKTVNARASLITRLNRMSDVVKGIVIPKNPSWWEQAPEGESTTQGYMLTRVSCIEEELKECMILVEILKQAFTVKKKARIPERIDLKSLVDALEQVKGMISAMRKQEE